MPGGESVPSLVSRGGTADVPGPVMPRDAGVASHPATPSTTTNASARTTVPPASCVDCSALPRVPAPDGCRRWRRMDGHRCRRWCGVHRRRWCSMDGHRCRRWCGVHRRRRCSMDGRRCGRWRGVHRRRRRSVDGSGCGRWRGVHRRRWRRMDHRRWRRSMDLHRRGWRGMHHWRRRLNRGRLRDRRGRRYARRAADAWSSGQDLPRCLG